MFHNNIKQIPSPQTLLNHSIYLHDASTKVQSSRSWSLATALQSLEVSLASFTVLHCCVTFDVATCSHVMMLAMFEGRSKEGRSLGR
jgi:hypothetical protein